MAANHMACVSLSQAWGSWRCEDSRFVVFLVDRATRPRKLSTTTKPYVTVETAATSVTIDFAKVVLGLI